MSKKLVTEGEVKSNLPEHKCVYESKEALVDKMCERNAKEDYSFKYNEATKTFTYQDEIDCYEIYNVLFVEVTILEFNWNTCTDNMTGQGSPCDKGQDVTIYRAVTSIKSDKSDKMVMVNGTDKETIKKEFEKMKAMVWEVE